MRYRIVALVLLALIFPAAASAAPGDAAGLFVSQQTWGTPACGLPHLEVSTPTEYLAAHDTGVFDTEPDAWADPARCAIVLNPNVRIRTAVKRCHVIAHEWGHLDGYRDEANDDDPVHSWNPKSLMYATDVVTEGRVRTGERSRWTASGAFRPCYRATAPGASYG